MVVGFSSGRRASLKCSCSFMVVVVCGALSVDESVVRHCRFHLPHPHKVGELCVRWRVEELSSAYNLISDSSDSSLEEVTTAITRILLSPDGPGMLLEARPKELQFTRKVLTSGVSRGYFRVKTQMQRLVVQNVLVAWYDWLLLVSVSYSLRPHVFVLCLMCSLFGRQCLACCIAICVWEAPFRRFPHQVISRQFHLGQFFRRQSRTQVAEIPLVCS